MSASAPGKITSEDLTANTAGQNDIIAALAYKFWQDRGCPIGSPDEDWFRAEKELSTDRDKVADAVAA